MIFLIIDITVKDDTLIRLELLRNYLEAPKLKVYDGSSLIPRVKADINKSPTGLQ